MVYILYEIQPNDTFYKLALKYNSTVELIQNDNGHIDPRNIPIGINIKIPVITQSVDVSRPYTSFITKDVIDNLTREYDFITCTSIGKSVMGRDILSLKIGTGKRTLLFNASHHANESITTPLVLKFIDEYAFAYKNNGYINNIPARDLFERNTLYVVPLVNPDGVDLVNGLITKGLYYDSAVEISKRYPSIPFPYGWKANIAGTDINLSYPALWEKAREIKYAQGFTSPAPRDFVGTAPLSSPESKAMYIYTLQINPQITLSFHTQGGEIYYSFLDNEPVGARKIADRFAYVSGYNITQSPYTSSFAGYKDWFILNYMRPGFTIEAGYGENPLPMSDFEDIYKECSPIMTEALSYTE